MKSRLKSLAPGLSSLRPLVSTQRDASGHSRALDPWRGWYNLARWRALRLRVFTRDLFTCQWQDCGRIEGDTSRLVADHREPHKGDPRLFWDEENVQTLCKTCHDKAKQTEERAVRMGGGMVAPASATTPGKMSRPAWFRRAHVPLTVVCGPPGAGKSTYVRENAGPGDLIICFDQLAVELLGGAGRIRPQADLSASQIADVLRVRNERLGDLMRAKAKAKWPAAWLIVSEPNPQDRTWWAETTGASIVVLATPPDECRRRIAADAAAGDQRGAKVSALVDAWWRAYAPARCDRSV